MTLILVQSFILKNVHVKEHPHFTDDVYKVLQAKQMYRMEQDLQSFYSVK